ncbi:unnamed protein product [Symbiodinium sp. KB8]|nr:unnamed protein product [Symbiodinium sp. KB8]
MIGLLMLPEACRPVRRRFCWTAIVARVFLQAEWCWQTDDSCEAHGDLGSLRCDVRFRFQQNMLIAVCSLTILVFTMASECRLRSSSPGRRSETVAEAVDKVRRRAPTECPPICPREAIAGQEVASLASSAAGCPVRPGAETETAIHRSR